MRAHLTPLFRGKTRTLLRRARKVRYGHCDIMRTSQAHDQLCRTIHFMSECCYDGLNATRKSARGLHCLAQKKVDEALAFEITMR